VAKDKQTQLDEITARIMKDDPTPELRAGATQLVPGEGNADATLMFIGEAPGAKEDEQGRPFVGAAGKFLEEMLASIKLDRADVFITNIVKYRPPNNRDPEPAEIKAMLPYLLAQIKTIKPKLVIFLGRHSMNVFFPELTISQAHGQPYRRSGQVFLPLFHPAAALYNGGMRQTLLEDFYKIPQILAQIKS